jgi:transcriptional regulator with XRE-family HTH domain
MIDKTFAEFLNHAYVEYAHKQGRYTSQSEFATYLGISNYNYSQYVNNYRKPTGKNLDRIAAKLGPRTYEILGVPPRMPDDPVFLEIAKRWFAADDKTQEQVLAILQGNANKTTQTINPAVD